jgi:hypothetical protein
MASPESEAAVNSPKLARSKRCKDSSVVESRPPSLPVNSSTRFRSQLCPDRQHVFHPGREL